MVSSKKQLRLGTILSYISIAINIIAGLIYTPWMIDKIGQGQYGLYTLANSLIALFLVDFGLSTATSRFVAKYHAEGDEEKVNRFLGAVYKLYLIIDAIIFIALFVIFLLIDVIYANLTPVEIDQFKVVYIISASFAVVNFPFVTFNGILNAYEKFIPLKLADIIYRVLLVGSTVVALLLGQGLYALVALHAVVGLVLIIYKFIAIKRTTPVKANFRVPERSLYKTIFSFSIWATVASLAQRLIFNITPTILGIAITENTSAVIAVFGVVVTIEGYSYLITGAINGMFMTRISRQLTGESDSSQLTPLLLKVGKFQYAINGLIVSGFAVIGKLFINLWMGPEFSEAYLGILLVLIPGIFYNSLQIANTTLVVTNNVKLQAIVNAIMGLVNVALSLLLSYLFGVVGACLSIFVAYMIRAVILNVIYYKKLHFDIPKFIRECYIRMSIPIVLTIAMSLGINFFLPDTESWILLVLKALIVFVVYVTTMLVFGFDKSEKQSIINKITKRKSK